MTVYFKNTFKKIKIALWNLHKIYNVIVVNTNRFVTYQQVNPWRKYK